MELDKVLWIIPPAIILGIIWYFIKLFGKMIDDYNPYSDDRAYSSELNGLTYFISNIIYPLLFVFFTYMIIDSSQIIEKLPLWSLVWIPPIVVYLIYLMYSVKIRFVSIKFFDRKDSLEFWDFIFGILDFLIKDWGKNSKKILFKPVKRDKLWVYLIFLMGLINYFSSNLISIGITGLFMFLTLLLIPSNYSMKKYGLMNANIIMKNKKDNIDDCQIIRVNKNSVRAKKDNKIHIINRSEILKIEVLPKSGNE